MHDVELTLAHSPDSDDLVMWWPLTGMHDEAGDPFEGDLGKPALDTGRYRFHSRAMDVEALNRLASEGSSDFDITAISAAAYPSLQDVYAITSCGGSFGEGYGPKVVVRAEDDAASLADVLDSGPVAIPGSRTTAFCVLQLLHGSAINADAMRFDLIPESVRSGAYRAGLLIHEAQLTFERHGLRVLMDLGASWQATHGVPLPLGLNVVRRDLDDRFGLGTVNEVARLSAASVVHAVREREHSRAFLRARAGDERPEWHDQALVDRYLSMYVSPLSEDMGVRGRDSLALLYRLADQAGLLKPVRRLDIAGASWS